MQSNLNQWLKIKDLNIPQYFYWKWGKNAYWTQIEPSGNARLEINWKEYNHKVILVGDFPISLEYNFDHSDPDEFKISIMKSHIQKCVQKWRAIRYPNCLAALCGVN